MNTWSTRRQSECAFKLLYIRSVYSPLSLSRARTIVRQSFCTSPTLNSSSSKRTTAQMNQHETNIDGNASFDMTSTMKRKPSLESSYVCVYINGIVQGEEKERENERKKEEKVNVLLCVCILFCFLDGSCRKKRKSYVRSFLFHCRSWINGCSNVCLTFKRFSGSNRRILSKRSRNCSTFFIWSSGRRWWPMSSDNNSRQGLMLVIVDTLS